MMYQSSHFTSATPSAISLLADAVRRPLFLPEEIDAQRDAAAYEIREISAKPEMVLPEILHQVAYQNNTLGIRSYARRSAFHTSIASSLRNM
jgi:processing peptidase subunit alpha